MYVGVGVHRGRGKNSNLRFKSDSVHRKFSESSGFSDLIFVKKLLVLKKNENKRVWFI